MIAGIQERFKIAARPRENFLMPRVVPPRIRQVQNTAVEAAQCSSVDPICAAITRAIFSTIALAPTVIAVSI
jgi:hypothetical protein